MEKIIFNLLIVFKWTIYLSLVSVPLIIFILLFKRVTKYRLTAQLEYALWFLLIIRLAVPILPQTHFSAYNLFPVTDKKPPVSSFVDKPQSGGFYKNIISFEEKDFSSLNMENDYSLIFYLNRLNPKERIPFVIWLVGILLISLYTFIAHIKFSNKVNRDRHIKDEKVLNILHECTTMMKIKKKIPIIEVIYIKSPAMYKFINPKILIPNNLIKNINDDDLRNIFLHELSHFKRKDILVNYIAGIISIFYWFNPLIWYVFRKMKQDREICCDATALSYIEPHRTKEYGYTMINLIKYSSTLPRIDMIAGMLENKSNLKRRITMIKSFRKSSKRLTMVLISILFIFSSIMLTEAKTSLVLNGNPNISSRYIIDELGRNRLIDNIEYPFVNDTEVVGKWLSVDFVEDVSDFKVGQRWYKDELYFKDMEFVDNGNMEIPVRKWTKGIITHKNDMTASEYFIKKINGESYMFFQWKSGDYTFRRMKPYYYVLKKVNK